MISFEHRLTSNVAENQAIELMKGFDMEKFLDLYMLNISQHGQNSAGGFVAQMLHWKTMTTPRGDMPDFVYKPIMEDKGFSNGGKPYKDDE